MKTPILIIAITALLSGGTVCAADSLETSPQVSTEPWEEYSVEEALTAFELNYDLWLEMELDGVQSEVTRLEKNLLGLLSNDIYMSQERVRDLAGTLAKAKTPESQVKSARLLEQETTFQQALSELNAKEALYRAVTKTTAFSNKYRLLGDYINLLRRELELPRLKLANEKVADPVTGKTGSTLPDPK